MALGVDAIVQLAKALVYLPADRLPVAAGLNSAGVRIGRANLAFLSPYPTSKLKRFED